MKNSSLSRVPGTGVSIQRASAARPVLGELVHALAAAVARDALADDQAIALEPRERRVDLPGVQRRQQLSELLLQRLPELVPVAALAGEKGKESSRIDSENIYALSIAVKS